MKLCRLAEAERSGLGLVYTVLQVFLGLSPGSSTGGRRKGDFFFFFFKRGNAFLHAS